MKKPYIHPLLFITLLFAAFTIGFFAGRNYNHADVQVSVLHANALWYQDSGHTTEDETQPTTEGTSPSEAMEETTEATDPSGLININTATAAQLQTLPGIGETIAQRIIDYREANGPFKTPASLINVKGIGEKKLAAIIDLITV